MRRKGSLLRAAHAKPKRVYQERHRDEFGEGAERKRIASSLAREHGHQMASWHRRLNDPFNRWNAYCSDCNMTAVVVAAVEPPPGLGFMYGQALHAACSKVRQS